MRRYGYEIFQTDVDTFERLSFMKKYGEFKKENYYSVYSGAVYQNSKQDALEALFMMFNCDRPSDFAGHSLSVSDVVVLNENESVWFCDAYGWIDVTKEW